LSAHAEEIAEGPGDLAREVLSVSAIYFFAEAFTCPFSSDFSVVAGTGEGKFGVAHA